MLKLQVRDQLMMRNKTNTLAALLPSGADWLHWGR